MRKSQFSEEQIIGVLKEVEGGLAVGRFAGSTGSAIRRTTPGKRSTAGCQRSAAAAAIGR
jgi:hypothetical protein